MNIINSVILKVLTCVELGSVVSSFGPCSSPFCMSAKDSNKNKILKSSKELKQQKNIKFKEKIARSQTIRNATIVAFNSFN
jgi:hypothetical protein